MVETIFAMMLWIETNTDYQVSSIQPNIVITEPSNLCVAYGINDKGQCGASRLLGFYDKNMTIYLRDDYQHGNIEHASWLLHELIHYVQWENGQEKTTCLGELEAEAYELQDVWRAQFGLEPKVDPFKLIMLSASCED